MSVIIQNMNQFLRNFCKSLLSKTLHKDSSNMTEKYIYCWTCVSNFFVCFLLEEFESWESLNFDSVNLIGCWVQLGNDDGGMILELVTQLLPFGSKRLAVAYLMEKERGAKNKIYYYCEVYFCCFWKLNSKFLLIFLFYETNKIINYRLFLT